MIDLILCKLNNKNIIIYRDDKNNVFVYTNEGIKIGNMRNVE